MAAHRGQELLPEGDVFIELDLQVEAEDPGVFPQETHPGQQGFFQAHEEAFLQGLVLDRGEEALHPAQGKLEDVPEDPFFIGKILVKRPLGDPGLGHQAVQGGGLIALVGEFRQGGVQDALLLVRRQLPEGGQGRFFWSQHDHLVIPNFDANFKRDFLSPPSP